MKSLFRNAALTSLLCLSLASFAGATPIDAGKMAQVQAEPSTSTNAEQNTQPQVLTAKQQSILEMLQQYMEMYQMGQKAIKSKDPKIQEMGKKMVQYSQEKMWQMITGFEW